MGRELLSGIKVISSAEPFLLGFRLGMSLVAWIIWDVVVDFCSTKGRLTEQIAITADANISIADRWFKRTLQLPVWDRCSLALVLGRVSLQESISY